MSGGGITEGIVEEAALEYFRAPVKGAEGRGGQDRAKAPAKAAARTPVKATAGAKGLFDIEHRPACRVLPRRGRRAQRCGARAHANLANPVAAVCWLIGRSNDIRAMWLRRCAERTAGSGSVPPI